MASAASPKRMVSSVFITLATPCRATVTQQQQPALQAHSAAARDPQRTAARVGPGDGVRSARLQRGDHSQAESHEVAGSKGQPGVGSSFKALHPQSAQLPDVGLNRGKVQRQNKGTESVPPPPVAVAALPSSPRTLPSGESTFLPPPPVQTSQSHYLTPDQQTGHKREEKPTLPSTGYNQDILSQSEYKNVQDTSKENKDVCGFCRKPVALSEPAIEALNRTYHDSCFQCRSCHIPLAGKEYYNKAGIPLCADCYQASLELCWACGEAITDHIIRALERVYHPPCFTCTTCKQQIGEQPFAQGEVGEVYCLEDYYRKYAPKCNACNELIIPKEDGTDSYNVECLGRSYHEYCYRCQVCGIQLSPEPNNRGCYPLDGKILCKPCHLGLISSEGHNY
ncbi:filamin-binding LIM protein 1 [Nelusetta ayraudi]|uniref:filamin-binding LIM protein 1 n=1 Tax=Nelusetta ayraudi TaxID=303726 RepID=UPI003F701F5A